MTCDFQRYYGLTLPDALSVVNPQTLLDLLEGLTGIDGSLYREWRLDHDKPQQGGGGCDDWYRLSNHAFTQDTMLLADMRNMLAAQFNAGLEKGSQHVPMVLMPGERKHAGKQAGHFSLADLQSMDL